MVTQRSPLTPVLFLAGADGQSAAPAVPLDPQLALRNACPTGAADDTGLVFDARSRAFGGAFLVPRGSRAYVRLAVGPRARKDPLEGARDVVDGARGVAWFSGHCPVGHSAAVLYGTYAGATKWRDAPERSELWTAVLRQ